MSKEKWTEPKTRGFVLSYLKKPSLWDSSCAEYCQKTEKERSYGELQSEFGLTLIEVRNKIRIFRTTYNQEKKKEDTVANYKPKLSWYQNMKTAFEGGKVKSFSKTPTKSKLHDMKKEKESIIQYDYDENHSIQIQQNDEEIDERVKQTEHQIIIEPYEDYEEDDEEEHFQIAKAPKEFEDNQRTSILNNSQQTLLSSNELFLQSLKSSLDQLSAEKNMRARISIQETLYKIMYDK